MKKINALLSTILLKTQSIHKPLIILCVLAVVIFFTHEVLHTLNWVQVKSITTNARVEYIIAAMFTTFFALCSMGFYDAFSFSAGIKNISFFKRWTIGFSAFAWSNLLSIGGLAGPAIRVFLYRRLGLSNGEITLGLATHYTASIFGITGWIIACTVPLPDYNFLITNLLRLIIAACIALSIAHVVKTFYWGFVQKILAKKFTDLPHTSPHKLLPLAITGVIDWMLTLLTFQLIFLSVGLTIDTTQSFFSGQLAGLLSLMPGGLGTADAIWLHLLSKPNTANETAAAITLFRAIFYFLPWTISAIAAYVYLVGNKDIAVQWQRRIIASIMGISSAFMMISGALPSLSDRIMILKKIVPIGVIEVSHFISVILAVALFYLAQGIYRGYRSAWLISIWILVISFIAHILKGGNYEEAGVAIFLCFLLLISHKGFTREGQLNLSREIILATAIGTLFAFTIVGFSAFEKINYRPELWLEFAFSNDVSRFLRAIPGILLVSLIFIFKQAIKTPKKKTYPSTEELQRAIEFCNYHANHADALLIGGTDKALWFWEQDSKLEGLIAYQIVGDSLVVYKDPVIIKNEKMEHLIRDFSKFADASDKRIVFSMISPEWMPVLHEFGFYFIKFSEEAIVNLMDFNLQGGRHAELRRTINYCEKQHVTFEILTPPHSSDVVNACREVSDAWLTEKGTSELQFTACYFSNIYLQQFPLAISKNAEGKIIAFVNPLILEQSKSATIDFMRYIPNTVKGIMDYTMVKTFLYCKNAGCETFSLGNAPLVETGREKSSRWVEKILYNYSKLAEHMYNYAGLYKYKAKFHPEWQPRYIAHQRLINWTRALSSALRAVKPTTTEEKKRIAAARIAATYPYENRNET